MLNYWTCGKNIIRYWNLEYISLYRGIHFIITLNLPFIFIIFRHFGIFQFDFPQNPHSFLCFSRCFVYTHNFSGWFFFGTFHTLYNFSTPIRISSLALARTRTHALSLCLSVFCFASQEFLYTRSRLAATLRQQLWRLFVRLRLLFPHRLPLYLPFSVASYPRKWCQPLAYFQSKRLFVDRLARRKPIWDKTYAKAAARPGAVSARYFCIFVQCNSSTAVTVTRSKWAKVKMQLRFPCRRLVV